MEVQYLDYKRPLRLTATINEVQVHRALVDMWSLLNLIPMSTLQAMNISKKKAPMEVANFRSATEHTIGHIQIALKVGPILPFTRFHVIHSYHVLFGPLATQAQVCLFNLSPICKGEA